MRFFYPNTRLIIIGLALLLTFLPLGSQLTFILAGILVGTIGLMHGATDHILYLNTRGQRAGATLPVRFFIEYLGVLMVFGFVWYLVPWLAFGIFILISAYHFGQTQLQYLPLSEKSWQKKATYALWGLGVLGMIVLLNPAESEKLINSMLQSPAVDDFFSNQATLLGFAMAGLCLLAILFNAKGSSIKKLGFEIAEVLVIMCFSYYANLVLSFALFFGLWHSLRASQVQIDKLTEDQPFSAKDFVKNSLAFTLISLVGIAGLIVAADQLSSQIVPEMLFLVAISLLTMPHMVIYERFYNRHDRATL